MKFDWSDIKNAYFRWAMVIAVGGLISTAVVFYQYVVYTIRVTEQTKSQTEFQAKKTAMKLDSAFVRIKKIADDIAVDIASGKLKNQNIRARLKSHLNYRNKLFGIGVAFVPNTSNPNLRNESPYYISVDSLKNIEKNNLIKVYSSPIFRIDSTTNNKLVTGYVYVDFLVTELKRMTDSLKLGKSGYGFLLSQEGSFVAHPVNEYNMNEDNINSKTIFELAIDKNDPQYYKLGEYTVMDSKHGVMSHENDITGQDSWMFYHPIPSIDWSLIVVFIIDEIPIKNIALRNYLFFISILIVITIIGFSTIFTRVYKGKSSSLTWFSVIVAVLLFVEIAYVWHLTLKYDLRDDPNAIKIVDKTGLDNVKNIYNRDIRNRCKEDPIYIPTGLFIESMQFPTSNTIYLTGYIWQKYDPRALKTIGETERGVIFTDAVDDEIRETFHYVSATDNFSLYGWYFQLTIKKTFDFSKYPLDKKNLMIRIVPVNLEKKIVLAPDLDAYKFINPNMLPGLHKDLIIENWNIISSNFLYKKVKYQTNFGIDNFNCKDDTPELYFDVYLTRNFISALIANLLPILIMLSVLFILFIIATRNIDLVPRVLTPLGTFFWAILYAQVAIRSDLASANMVYLEYIYILMYFFLLLIFLNAVMYSRETNWFLIHYKKNLIIKLIFWPFVNFVLLTLTIYLLIVKA